MKKIALFLITIITLYSCSVDDNRHNYTFEVLPVESYTIPESFNMNGIYEIKLKYKRPTDCHIYEGIYYEKNGDYRTIGIQTSVLDNDNCNELNEEPIEVAFNFECTPGYQQYIFKLYKGKDAQGNEIFEDVIVPVTY